jgi:hypothetical protein
VYVTIWDPRQVQLRIAAGTREPISATGEQGTGMVPRDPQTLRLLVGAFNGGFQALHGEFGMMADDRVYIPPKPWAATVAVFEDGRVGMGSWPAPSWRGTRLDEELANRQIPEAMVDFRQNLTSVVEDGRYNPWRRWYWGAAPEAADEQTYTARSALCLTEEGYFAYFWSRVLGPEALGTAMLRARCVRGIHLDMNAAHCGFEFFRPISPGESVPALPHHPIADFEWEGRFPDADGFRLRMRRGVRSMGMPFPRYSEQDARDFFYLVLRPVLPGPDLDGAHGREGVFRTEGLPHAGWPHAFARASVGHRTWIVRIDPRRAVPSPIRAAQERALAYLTEGAALARQGAPHALFAHRNPIGWTFAVGRPSQGDRVIVAGPALSAESQAAIGVDRDGLLVYAERSGDPTPLAERMRQAGITDAVALGSDVRLAFAADHGFASPNGDGRSVSPASSLAFLAEERRETEVLFPDNHPIPYRMWGRLQDQRVRYFPEKGMPRRFMRPPPRAQ